MNSNKEIQINEITSKENTKIKNIAKLNQKKFRNEFGKFVIENWKIIEENTGEKIQCQEIFVTKKFLKQNEIKLKEIAQENLLSEIYLVPENLMKKMSTLSTFSGVIASYKKQKSNFHFNENLIVYLNSVKDPGNLGTILRSALAFGFKNIILDENCVDLYNEKVLHACKGVNFKLNIFIEKEDLILEKLKENQYSIFITDVNNGKNLNNFQFDEEKICLVLGNESFGIDEKIRSIADKKIIIPTTKLVESLNVSISAGIIFYDIFKKRS